MHIKGISFGTCNLACQFQHFGHLMWRTDLLEKTLMLGKIEGGRRRDNRGWDGWMASLTQWTWVWTSSRRWWRTGKPGVLQSMGLQRIGHDWATEVNWTRGKMSYWSVDYITGTLFNPPPPFFSTLKRAWCLGRTPFDKCSSPWPEGVFLVEWCNIQLQE